MEEVLATPATRMIVNYLINGVLGPLTAPWQATRGAKAREITARSDANVLSIHADAQSEALRSVADAYTEVLESLPVGLDTEHDLEGLVLQVTKHEQVRRQHNLLSVLAQAREFVGDTYVSDHEPDPDWTSRFFSDVQDVSSEGMQALWAKILAGEVERPGSTSIRTLGIMKDLDKPTASIFRRLCSLSVSLVFSDATPSDCRACSLGGDAGQNALEEYGLNFPTLNILNEHGLIISDYNSQQPYPYRYPVPYQSRHSVLLLSESPAKEGQFKIHGVAMTKSGRELSRVVECETGNDEVRAYHTALTDYFRSNGLTWARVGA